MQQDKIWDYFQNHEVLDVVFPEARQRYFLKLINTGQRVLNIGVGSGAFERLALKNGIDVYALDPSKQTIDKIRHQLELKDKARAGYAQDIPFETNFFDVVLMSEVLEHLDDEALSSALPEVFRVLKSGGRLLISVPYREDLLVSQVVCPNCGNVFHKIGHVQSFDKSRMLDLLKSHGYLVERIWLGTFIDWRRKGLFKFFKSLLRMMLAKMGEGIADPHLFAIAKKP